MKNTDALLTPVLLGGDLNAYSMATAYARYNGSYSHVFARERLALTDMSPYIKLHTIKDLDDCNVAVPALLDFAKENSDKRFILIPCADWYMEMLEYARDALAGHFYFFIPDFEIWRTTSDKAIFLSILDKYGIPHPKTAVFDASLLEFEKRGMKMEPPFVIKPSDSSEYWRNSFEGMKKVYISHSLDEAKHIAERIFASGYGGKILLQEFIGKKSSPASASVLTTYSNKRAKVIRAVIGDVLLEELAPRARGNYSAIVTRPLDKICYKIIDMLEGIGYTGIANFDILYSEGNGYCLELNPRQGRSFDYIRGAGISLPALFEAEYSNQNIAPVFSYKETLWRAVKRTTVVKYSRNKALLSKAMTLEKNGASISPYDFRGDKKLMRKLYVAVHLSREAKRYKKYGEDGLCC